jgi:hypothetical protein
MGRGYNKCGKDERHKNFQLENAKRRGHLGDLGVDSSAIITMILK